MNDMRGVSALGIVLAISSPVFAADWTQWELDNSVAREQDWLVIRQPGEGFCYLKQSYASDSTKMEMTTGRSGIPALVTPFYQGIRGNITYQVDDREPGLISAADIENASLIPLPRSLTAALKAGRELRVRVTPVGEAPQTQVFSLLGFTAASKWLERDICQFEGSQEATGADGGTALDVSLVKASDGKIQVVGETNLPDGMQLMISLRNPNTDYFAQDKVTVNDSRFQSAAFSNRGAALPSGAYEVSISSPLPRLQSSSVRAAIGEDGEGLKGPAVVEEDGKRRIDWTVRRNAQ